jgi:NAD-specific glutamate dehydrogenase
MDGATISALAALAGSVVGGLTALGTSWVTQQAQTRAQESARDRTAREALFSDFIVEASRLYGDALEHDKTEVPNLVGLYAMISRMRVRSSPRVIENAEQVGHTIVETYLAPNRTLRDLVDMLGSEPMDPLRGFSEACRDELRSLRAGAGVPGLGTG